MTKKIADEYRELLEDDNLAKLFTIYTLVIVVSPFILDTVLSSFVQTELNHYLSESLSALLTFGIASLSMAVLKKSLQKDNPNLSKLPLPISIITILLVIIIFNSLLSNPYLTAVSQIIGVIVAYFGFGNIISFFKNLFSKGKSS